MGIGWCLCCEVEAERIQLLNKLVGDVTCSDNSVVEHQPCLLRVPGWFLIISTFLPNSHIPFPFLRSRSQFLNLSSSSNFRFKRSDLTSSMATVHIRNSTMLTLYRPFSHKHVRNDVFNLNRCYGVISERRDKTKVSLERSWSLLNEDGLFLKIEQEMTSRWSCIRRLIKHSLAINQLAAASVADGATSTCCYDRWKVAWVFGGEIKLLTRKERAL